MVFVAMSWCGLGVVRFQSAVVGLLWGWLVVDSHKAIKRRKCFFLLRFVNLGARLRGCLIDWVLVLD